MQSDVANINQNENAWTTRPNKKVTQDREKITQAKTTNPPTFAKNRLHINERKKNNVSFSKQL